MRKPAFRLPPARLGCSLESGRAGGLAALARPLADRMNRRRILSLLLTVSIWLIGWWWFNRPLRTTEVFVGHMLHERYAEAAAMLDAPSAIEWDADGGLVLTSDSGATSPVVEEELPFFVYRMSLDESELSLTDLLAGRSTFQMRASALVMQLNVTGDRIIIAGFRDNRVGAGPIEPDR